MKDPMIRPKQGIRFKVISSVGSMKIIMYIFDFMITSTNFKLKFKDQLPFSSASTYYQGCSPFLLSCIYFLSVVYV